MNREIMMRINILKEKESDFRLFTVLNGGKIENVECGWIRVTEQLPPEGIEVLVSYEYKSITDPKQICYSVEAGNYYQGDWGVSSFKYMHKGADPKVGAWKPMPEPYEGGGGVTREELKEKCCDVCFYSDEGQASPSVRMRGCKIRMAYEIGKAYERGFIEGQKNPLFGKILDLKDDKEVEE